VLDGSLTRPARARPVCEPASDELLERGEELAKRWAVALLLLRPLADIGQLPLADLADEAPSLCVQALRALESDVELERLTGADASRARGGAAQARRLAALAGAHEPAAAVAAVEALRGVLWTALLEHMREPSARQVGDIADRLAYVCASVLAAALDAASDAASAHGPHEEAELTEEPEAAPMRPRAEPRRSPAGVPSARRAVIVDERTVAPASERAAHERPLSWDESPPVPPGARAGEIEIRDERGEEGPGAWIRSIGGQLQRFEHDRLPFAVLLVELVEIERLGSDELPAGLATLLGRVESALTAALEPASGSLTRERTGRYWLLMPHTDRGGARELAERIVRTVAASAGDRGAPLEVAIGVAMCPQDGQDAAELAAHADIGLYADRSAVRAAAARAARSAG
jgi:GGDEF domain-containing protein